MCYCHIFRVNGKEEVRVILRHQKSSSEMMPPSANQRPEREILTNHRPAPWPLAPGGGGFWPPRSYRSRRVVTAIGGAEARYKGPPTPRILRYSDGRKLRAMRRELTGFTHNKKCLCVKLESLPCLQILWSESSKDSKQKENYWTKLVES